VDVADHLQRLSLADLFVDTPQYNGGTTGAAAAAAALWCGVVSHTLCAQCAKRALRQAMRLRAAVAAQHIHSVRGAR
jgi:predicted O-linked N-acetylglucosamine transferase (SPINDLY family)